MPNTRGANPMHFAKLGWKRPRISIRVLMIVVAVVGVVIATARVDLPWLRWRMRVDQIIAKKLTASDKLVALFSSPTFQQYNKLTKPEYEDVLGDPHYVADRLFLTAIADPDAQRRAQAFATLSSVLVEAHVPAVAHEFLGRVLVQAVGGRLPPDGERSAITVVEQLGLDLGLDDAYRSAILSRARQVASGPDPGDVLPFWVSLVGRIGGPAETQFLLELEYARDPESFTFKQGSRLMHSRLPVLLDHIRRWLDQPARALGALDYTILPCTNQGRRLLLDVVLTPGRDQEVRRKAMRLLKRDRYGAELLLKACENPDHRKLVGQFYGPDQHNLTVFSNGLPAQLDGWALASKLAEAKNPDDPRPELRELGTQQYDLYVPWQTLVFGVDPANWAHIKRRLLEKGKSEAEVDHIVREVVEGDLAITRELSGRHDLSTPQEWQQWFRGAEPNLKQIPYGRWFDQMIAHPNLTAVNEFGGQINATNSVCRTWCRPSSDLPTRCRLKARTGGRA